MLQDIGWNLALHGYAYQLGISGQDNRAPMRRMRDETWERTVQSILVHLLSIRFMNRPLRLKHNLVLGDLTTAVSIKSFPK